MREDAHLGLSGRKRPAASNGFSPEYDVYKSASVWSSVLMPRAGGPISEVEARTVAGLALTNEARRVKLRCTGAEGSVVAHRVGN